GDRLADEADVGVDADEAAALVGDRVAVHGPHRRRPRSAGHDGDDGAAGHHGQERHGHNGVAAVAPAVPPDRQPGHPQERSGDHDGDGHGTGRRPAGAGEEDPGHGGEEGHPREDAEGGDHPGVADLLRAAEVDHPAELPHRGGGGGGRGGAGRGGRPAAAGGGGPHLRNRIPATTTRTTARVRRTAPDGKRAWKWAPARPPRRLPAMTGAAWCSSIRPWMAKTIRAAADVIPTVKVVVEAATLIGTPMTSVVAGVLMNPPLAPATPATTPAVDITASPAGSRRAR